MNKGLFLAVLIVLFLQITAVFAAPPDISYFKIEKVYPNHMQFSWEVSDPAGLALLEIYQDGEKIYEEDLDGEYQKSLYQVLNDDESHMFKFIVYDSLNLSSIVTKARSGDIIPPVVDTHSKITANTKNISFTTNEQSTCKIGLSDKEVSLISPELQTDYNIQMPLKEGLNRVFIQCTDAEDNTMPGFFIVEYTYDITPPEKVADVTSKGNRISWSSSEDGNGIDHYIIYNSLKSIATTFQTYWDANTNESIYFISAVDKAGNEGGKAEYNLGRIELLSSDFAVQNKTTAEQTIELDITEENITGRQGISTTATIAWIAFGVLLLVYIGWRIYEQKKDPHGLRHYIKSRRKMREIDIQKRQ